LYEGADTAFDRESTAHDNVTPVPRGVAEKATDFTIVFCRAQGGCRYRRTSYTMQGCVALQLQHHSYGTLGTPEFVHVLIAYSDIRAGPPATAAKGPGLLAGTGCGLEVDLFDACPTRATPTAGAVSLFYNRQHRGFALLQHNPLYMLIPAANGCNV